MCDEVEGHLHVPRCQSKIASTEWAKHSEAFSQWLHDFGTAPEIAESLSSCLRKVREPSGAWDVPWVRFNIIPHHDLSRALLYFRAQGSRRSGTKWAAAVSKHLIMIGFYMWEARNRIQHSQYSRSYRSLSISINQAIRHQFGLDSSGLPFPVQRQLRLPIGKILSLPLKSRQRWVKWIQLERSLLEQSLRSRKTLIFAFAHSGRKRRRAFRSKRLFKKSVPPKRFTQLEMGPWISSE